MLWRIFRADSIGQLQHLYLAQGDSGLYIIDQHAAHERIYYDEFKRKYHNGFYSQMLAVPISIELTYSEVGKLIDNILLFNSLELLLSTSGIELLFFVVFLKVLLLKTVRN